MPTKPGRKPGRPPSAPGTGRTSRGINLSPQAWAVLESIAESRGIPQNRVIEELIMSKDLLALNLRDDGVNSRDREAMIEARQAADERTAARIKNQAYVDDVMAKRVPPTDDQRAAHGYPPRVTE